MISMHSQDDDEKCCSAVVYSNALQQLDKKKTQVVLNRSGNQLLTGLHHNTYIHNCTWNSFDICM